MAEIKELLEDIQKNTAGLRTELDNVKSAREAEQAEFKAKLDKYDDEFKGLRTQYEDEKKAREALELQLKRSNFTGGENGESAEQKAARELQKKAVEKFLRFGVGESSKAAWKPEEQKALSELIDSEGGYLIPPDFENEIITIAQYDAQIRGVANTGTTSRDRVDVSKLMQRATIGWGTEAVAVSPQDLQFGLEQMPIHEITALVLAPNTLLEDSDADIFAELATVFGQDIAFAEDSVFTSGDGIQKPEGILTNAKVLARYAPSGVAGDITDGTNAHNGVDPIIDTMYKLKNTYRANGTWAFNSNTEGRVRKLKDQYGQYLWQPPVQAGAPASLLGRPVILAEAAPDIAANAFPIIFGDFRRGYRIRDRKGMTIQRLVERYAEYRQTGFLVTKRVGGQVVLDEAFAVLKIAAN